jgi:hypothetical protein
MSISGFETSAPAAVTTRTLPPFSATNMRPSGAQATAVGAVSPETTVRSSKPVGNMAAMAEETPARRAILAIAKTAAALPGQYRIAFPG